MNERYSLATGVPHQLLYVDDRGKQEVQHRQGMSMSNVDTGYLSTDVNSNIFCFGKPCLTSTDVRHGVEREQQFAFAQPGY